MTLRRFARNRGIRGPASGGNEQFLEVDMNRSFYHLKAFLSCTALLGVLSAQAESPNEKAVSVVVTAAGLHNNTPPILTRSDVVVLQQREPLPVVQVSPYQNDRA